MPREVLLCGACLVGSTEVIRKLRGYGRLVNRYGCVAIEDVNDIDAMSAALAHIAIEPGPAAAVGARGREFARSMQENVQFPLTLEKILESVARRRAPPKNRLPEDSAVGARNSRFMLTELVANAIEASTRAIGARCPPEKADFNLARAREVMTAVERGIADGRASFRPFAPPVRLEIAIAEAESEADRAIAEESDDPLFRLSVGRWAMLKSDLPGLVPVRDRGFRVIEFDHDISQYRNVDSLDDLPTAPLAGPSYILAFGYSDSREQDPLLVDARTVRILELSDGRRTALAIAKQLRRECRTSRLGDLLECIERLFVSGLLGLRATPAARPEPTGK
jgi:hypothetical protein